MGKVGEQLPRNSFKFIEEDIESDCAMAKRIAKEEGMSIGEVIGIMRWQEECRRNCIMVQDGDYKDEHIDGLVQALNNLASISEYSGSAIQDGLKDVAHSIEHSVFVS